MTRQEKNGCSVYAQVYEQLSRQRDLLVETFDPRSGLKERSPSDYHHYQKKIRELNRRLRVLRLHLMAQGLEL